MTSRADAISPEWSSSTTRASCRRRTAASSRARVDVMLTPVGLWARGCRTTTRAPASSARLERVGTHAVPVERDGDAFEPELVQEVEQGREAGVLDGDAGAVAGDAFEGAADGVEGAVDDGDALRRERPRVPQQHLEGGHDGGGDVGAGVGGGPLEGDAGQGGTDQGQQLGVGRAGRQVEAGGRAAGEVAVAGREPAGGRGEHDGPGATAGDHDADGRERLPGAAHGRGADAEVGGEGADGREPVAGPQVTAADEARHGRRDAARAAVVDVGGEVHAGQDARREPGPRRPSGRRLRCLRGRRRCSRPGTRQ